MKHLFRLKITILLLCSSLNSKGQIPADVKEPYYETVVQKDTLVAPDVILLRIELDENSNRNKKSTEDLEEKLLSVLRMHNVDVAKQLHLKSFASNFRSYFLQGKKVIKVKSYTLKLYKANQVARIIIDLEEKGIANVQVIRTYVSEKDSIQRELIATALKNAKTEALTVLKQVDQIPGYIIYAKKINPDSNIALQGVSSGIRIRGASSIYGNSSKSSYFETIDFTKIKFSAKVLVRFAISQTKKKQV